MGFLTSAEAVVTAAVARAMVPPPPPDITRWCEENIEFDERSPMPGPFNIDRFPFLREIHEVLSPEHPAREVTIRGSAQWGKTVSIIQPTIGAWHEYGPLDSLVVHPTLSAATEWVNNKWLPMRRQARSLRDLFGDVRSSERRDTTFNQETADRNGSLKVASAGSPADLTGTSRKLVIMDDVSKFEASKQGDPEALAESRASGFDEGKILRVSTAMIAGVCRITRAYNRGDRRQYHVPCPHCGNMAPLTWENFLRNIDPERLHAACFSCDACGCEITHADKEKMVSGGKWVPGNPAGDHPSFHLWRAYAPQRDWASIAIDYAKVMGWTALEVGQETSGPKEAVEAETEQTFWNDVLGLPFEQAQGGPDWEALRDRIELAEDGAYLPKGVVPADGVLLTAGVDCQDDRTEVHVVAFGRNFQRWVIDYRVIPHHISEQKCWATLDALLKASWRTTLGLPLKLDMMSIDVGTYTDDVWDYGKRHPWSRVILVKGGSSQTGPIMAPMKFERRADGKAKRAQKRAFILNVSQMKADFYGRLDVTDPVKRGFVSIAKGLGDEYFRQVSSEVRVTSRDRSGITKSKWELAEPSRRNEALDTMLYAEAAARRVGWSSMTEAQWDQLAAERGAAPVNDTPDLFDATLVPEAVEAAPEPVEQPTRRRGARGQVH